MHATREIGKPVKCLASVRLAKVSARIRVPRGATQSLRHKAAVGNAQVTPKTLRRRLLQPRTRGSELQCRL